RRDRLRLRLNRPRPNRLRRDRLRLHPNRLRPNRPRPNRPRPNRPRPNRLRRERQQGDLQPAAVKQNLEKAHRGDRTERKTQAGRAQHCQLQLPGQEVTMIPRHDRTKTLVALAMWVG
ncbi:hypothetical protein, partial [Paraburkholderia elongata]|uniref:hypothetical protein n=1 Tax=Paraburkholderia elongata TaxID=2675747 RepID=UPI001C12FB8C